MHTAQEVRVPGCSAACSLGIHDGPFLRGSHSTRERTKEQLWAILTTFFELLEVFSIFFSFWMMHTFSSWKDGSPAWTSIAERDRMLFFFSPHSGLASGLVGSTTILTQRTFYLCFFVVITQREPGTAFRHRHFNLGLRWKRVLIGNAAQAWVSPVCF